jgi:hypothetical protein
MSRINAHPLNIRELELIGTRGSFPGDKAAGA